MTRIIESPLGQIIAPDTNEQLEQRVQTLEAQITLLNTQLKQILESLTK